MHTHNNFPSGVRPYVVLLSGANCTAPSIHEQFVEGNNIVVSGSHGGYAVRVVP
jgi:hypothetical protein